MKVILVNGSPHAKGCTYTALSHVAEALNENGVETEVFQIGSKPVGGCVACGRCGRKGGRCAFDDCVNEFLEKAETADGFVFGSPVYYASANSSLTGFLDRVFYAGGRIFRLKPAACVVSARRAGTTASLDQLNKYLTISEMPVISSCYWNMVHGFTPEDVEKDEEGVRIMRTLGNNMAWFLKCVEKARIPLPDREPPAFTNFIR